MTGNPGLVLLVFVCCCLVSAPTGAQQEIVTEYQCGSQPAVTQQLPEREEQPQPGATQGGVTTSEIDAQPKFDMDYFVGVWTFESTVSDSPLGTGGPMMGSETVSNVWDGRFWDIKVEGNGPDGSFTGQGVFIYQDTFAGESFTRYESTQGVALLKTGTVGCDLGGTCNLHFETPPFEHNGSRIQLRGRYHLISPYHYRLTSEISVDKGDYRNWRTVWYQKDLEARPPAIR